MTELLLIAVISTAAVTFFICFFTAARNDKPAERCRVVRISPSLQPARELSLPRTSAILLHRASAVLR